MSSHLLIPRGDAPFDLYPYIPSASAGYAFTAIFGIAAIAHFFYIFRLRSWFFIPLCLGCEAFGYYARAWSHSNIRFGRPYLIQLMLILGSAPLIAATVYMTLGRLVRGLDAARYSILRITWLTKIYVIIDIASFVTQMAGSAMQGSGDPEGLKLGQSLVMGGLGIQLFALFWFVLAAGIVHRRLNKEPSHIAKSAGVHWRRHFWMLHGVSALIVLRNAFRLIEFAAGSDSVLYTKEAFMYVFDAAVMALVVSVLVVVHPGRLLRNVRNSASMEISLGGS